VGPLFLRVGALHAQISGATRLVTERIIQPDFALLSDSASRRLFGDLDLMLLVFAELEDDSLIDHSLNDGQPPPTVMVPRMPVWSEQKNS